MILRMLSCGRTLGAFWNRAADLLVGRATNGGRRHACGRRRRFGHRRHRRSGRCRRQNALAILPLRRRPRRCAHAARALDAGEVDAASSASRRANGEEMTRLALEVWTSSAGAPTEVSPHG